MIVILLAMPGLDLQIGNDGDYIDDGVGGFLLTETAQPSIRHQILDRLGEWVGDIGTGRQLYGIAGRNASQQQLDLEIESIRRALEPLETDRIIDDVQISASRDVSRFIISVRCRDTQSGGLIDIPDLQEFTI